MRFRALLTFFLTVVLVLLWLVYDNFNYLKSDGNLFIESAVFNFFSFYSSVYFYFHISKFHKSIHSQSVKVGVAQLVLCLFPLFIEYEIASQMILGTLMPLIGFIWLFFLIVFSREVARLNDKFGTGYAWRIGFCILFFYPIGIWFLPWEKERKG